MKMNGNWLKIAINLAIQHPEVCAHDMQTTPANIGAYTKGVRRAIFEDKYSLKSCEYNKLLVCLYVFLESLDEKRVITEIIWKQYQQSGQLFKEEIKQYNIAANGKSEAISDGNAVQEQHYEAILESLREKQRKRKREFISKGFAYWLENDAKTFNKYWEFVKLQCDGNKELLVAVRRAIALLTTLFHMVEQNADINEQVNSILSRKSGY